MVKRAEQVQGELAAMRNIATILSEMEDGEARARVLRWASEIFASGDAATADTRALKHARDSKPAPDSNRDTARAAVAASRQDEALAFEGVESLFEKEPPPVEAPARSRATDPIESMIHGFVADFQRLADEWQHA